MENPVISVIIPVYKVEDYLERCLDSVIANTYQNLEIICVNDGSPDNCQLILERYAAKDSRIKVIVQENQGLSAARNTGLDHAAGKYLFYLDSDDWIHRRTFEFLLRAAEESGADIIVGGYQVVSDPTQPKQNTDVTYPAEVVVLPAEQFTESRRYYRDSVWGTLYHRSAVSGVRFPHGKTYGEDVFYKAMLLSGQDDLSVAFLDCSLYYYLSRPGSIMNSTDPDMLLANVKWWLSCLEQFKRKEFALTNVYRYIFFYRYSGIFCANPDTAKKNARIAVNKLRPLLATCKTLRMKQWARIVLSSHMPGICRMLLTIKDPSYKVWERAVKTTFKDKYLKKWDEVSFRPFKW